MSEFSPEQRRNLLNHFSKAWAAKNIEAIMDHFCEDCVYFSSIGPEPGHFMRGKSEVRDGIIAMLAHDNAVQSEVFNLTMTQTGAFWEWRYKSLNCNGLTTPTHGCDIFEFSDQKISVKNAFRKLHDEI